MLFEPYHPIDSLYDRKKKSSCHQWISAFFGQHLRDSGKYFACFLVIGFVYVPPFYL